MKPWSIEECEAYAKQLRDGTRANTAEHAAQAIEYLLSLVRREDYEQAQPLTDEEIETLWQGTSPYYDHQDFARAIEAKLKGEV